MVGSRSNLVKLIGCPPIRASSRTFAAVLLKTRGVVLRAKKYSETSIILDVYTEEKGMRSYLVSGVRTQRAKISPALMQVTSLLDMVVYHRDEKDLSRTKEIRPAYVYQKLPYDVVRSSVGLFVAEISRKTLREAGANAEIFRLIFDTLVHLDTTQNPVSNVHFVFLLRLAGYLGFSPGGEFSEKTPHFDMEEGYFVERAARSGHYLNEDLSRTLYRLLHTDLNTAHTITLDRTTRGLLLDRLLDFFYLHVAGLGELHAHKILQSVF